MRKFILISMIAITAATSFTPPSFAQSAKGGQGGGHSASERSGDWYPGTHNYPRRRPYLRQTSGDHCMFHAKRRVDAWGKVQVSHYRECREPRDIQIR